MKQRNDIRIYMDHAATTKLRPEAAAAMEPYLDTRYGNASTAYELGREARDAVERAREIVASVIKARPEEIYFTSGGSESDNWVIKSISCRNRYRGHHIITSKIEHHAVLNSCAYLEKLGYRVTYLNVDRQGIVDMNQLKNSLNRHTTLISIMYGNNEIGSIEPIRKIGMLARRWRIPFHTDAVQAIGQVPVSVEDLPVDALSASGHKFYGPKGVGFLYVRKEVDLPSFIHGGGQESGKRAGTENVAGIVGMAEALRLADLEMAEHRERIVTLRETLVRRVMREIPDVKYNGHPIERLPGNASFSFKGVEATALLVLLEEEGIFASAGSACSTGETRISHVIEAIHVPEEFASGTIRFSLGRETRPEEVHRCVEVLKESVGLLRKINEEED